MSKSKCLRLYTNTAGKHANPLQPGWHLQDYGSCWAAMQAHQQNLSTMESYVQSGTYRLLPLFREIQARYPNNAAAVNKALEHISDFVQDELKALEAREGDWFNDFDGGLDEE